jgi:hypothetical protein
MSSPLELLPETLVLFKIFDKAGLRSMKIFVKTNKKFASLLKPFIHDRILMRIKYFWRLHSPFSSTRLLIARFHAAKLTGHQIRAIGSDAMATHLIDKRVIFNTKLLLTRLLMVSISLCPQLQGATMPENREIRVFLTAYVAVYFPTTIFEQFGPRQRAVMHEGQVLLALVEAFIMHYEANSSFQTLPRGNCLALFAQMQRYTQAFLAWKRPDETRIITRIRHALYAIFFAARGLQPDLPQDAQVLREMETQTARLRAKLFQIGGAAAVDSLYDTIMDTLTFELYEALNPVDWE